MYTISNFSIKTKEEIEKVGIEFIGDISWDSEGYRILDNDEENGGKPINGYLYEKYKNGNLDYYAMFKCGLDEGETVEFYEAGGVKCYSEKSRGLSNGIVVEWYENGMIKKFEKRVYGILDTYTKWDEQGDIIEKVTETIDKNKDLIVERRKKYEC